jgi:hypothetical protein
MKFNTPTPGIPFEIPDEWWGFAEMEAFKLDGARFYHYREVAPDLEVDAVPLTDVEPPLRNAGVPPFKKYKMVPVLFAFTSPECKLPPIKVEAVEPPSRYRFKVRDGYHRYYASAAVGYPLIPVVIPRS